MNLSAEITGTCNECNEKNDIDSLKFYCYSCDNKRDDTMMDCVIKNIIEDIYKNYNLMHWCYDDSSFSSEEEKEKCKKFYKYGIIDFMFHISSEYGDETLKCFEKIACEMGDWH